MDACLYCWAGAVPMASCCCLILILFVFSSAASSRACLIHFRFLACFIRGWERFKTWLYHGSHRQLRNQFGVWFVCCFTADLRVNFHPWPLEASIMTRSCLTQTVPISRGRRRRGGGGGGENQKISSLFLDGEFGLLLFSSFFPTIPLDLKSPTTGEIPSKELAFYEIMLRTGLNELKAPSAGDK